VMLDLGGMLVEISTNRNGYTEIAVLKEATTNMCALGAIHELMHHHTKRRFELYYAVFVVLYVNGYHYLRQPAGWLFEACGKEVSRHYAAREHIIYDVSHDLFDVVTRVNSICEQQPERRKEIRKLLKSKDRPPCEVIKDYLLTIEAAEAL